MNHDELRDSLWEFLDGELSDARCKELQAHLEACGDCREDLQRLRGARTTLFRVPAAPTSADTEILVQRTMAKISEEFAWTGWRWLEAKWTLPALSLGFAAACFSILLAPPESLTPTDTLMLLSGQSRTVAQWVLSPDQVSGSSDLFSIGGEGK